MSDTPKKILIIEDQKPIAHALELKLTHAGCTTTTAADGEEALRILEKETFDLIVLDLVVPKMDGFKFLEEMRRRGTNQEVIVVSNLSQPEDVLRAKKLGVTNYFVKTDTPLKTIVEHITQIVQQRGKGWKQTTI